MSPKSYRRIFASHSPILELHQVTQASAKVYVVITTTTTTAAVCHIETPQPHHDQESWRWRMG